MTPCKKSSSYQPLYKRPSLLCPNSTLLNSKDPPIGTGNPLQPWETWQGNSVPVKHNVYGTRFSGSATGRVPVGFLTTKVPLSAVFVPRVGLSLIHSIGWRFSPRASFMSCGLRCKHFTHDTSFFLALHLWVDTTVNPTLHVRTLSLIG